LANVTSGRNQLFEVFSNARLFQAPLEVLEFVLGVFENVLPIEKVEVFALADAIAVIVAMSWTKKIFDKLRDV